MKKTACIWGLLISLLLLAACAGAGQAPAAGLPPGQEAPAADGAPTSARSGGQAAAPVEQTPTCVEPPVTMTFRIVDGAEEGRLLLAQLDPPERDALFPLYGEGVFTLNLCETGVWMEGELMESSVLKDGMTIAVTFWEGSLTKTYPAQIGSVHSIEAWPLGSEREPGGGYYDLCGLYLQVLDDLWEKDAALNEDISIAGLDLSNAPGGLTYSEQRAVAWRFGEKHGVEVVTENFRDYFTPVRLGDEAGEGPALYEWPDGCLFAIEPHGEDQEWPGFSLPTLRFDASKWRGPLAAYVFYGCTAVWPELGAWSEYTVGAEMIA